eukprot:CAMPEP_0198276474 /NCGR_PEP_ID=MMETSP1447-20131203/65334_1 /TAXON_ID=420782 /ORGANISM="Chaetoceros dichaeta, Strain CCMP1751" /LENGTH=356 /DNA_ID=CAMNT_0043971427 /DNA_START=101 /DNA_END=1171 /DNA_ORIENTATION=+
MRDFKSIAVNMMKMSPESQVIGSVISYSLCSGSLVLVNKLILHYLPFPSIVITGQLLASIFFIYGANMFGLIDIDPIKWDALKPYLVYTVAFTCGVYTNMMCLNTSNIETVIVARALSPLIVCALDPIFLGRELPSRRSIAALSLIAAGALGYAITDEAFIAQGISAYVYPFFYLIMITFEMVYGKKIVMGVKFETVSGPVQYTNLLGWPPMIAFAVMGGEFKRFGEFMRDNNAKNLSDLISVMPDEATALVVLGCFVGTGIGYSGWWCRNQVSATSFTLIGVINKCLTVMVNLMIWDQHAPPLGIASLFLCIIGGSFYRQAPMRAKKSDDIADTGGDLKMKETEEGILKEPLIKN